jgi:hypothetical protein
MVYNPTPGMDVCVSLFFVGPGVYSTSNRNEYQK